ncbi:MAG: hypothetical protein HY965_06595 [Ignavibacteriales bacterium]|nr:hypothetical protein [Ignavibacteriales bacterium]
MKRPVAIDINEMGELFLADTIANKVFKVQYNSLDNSISIPADYQFISGSSDFKPYDCDYFSGNLINDKSDDYIVVVDQPNNGIKIYHGNGQLITTLVNFWPIGGTAPVAIKRPQRAIFLNSLNIAGFHSIAFIQDDNTLVVGVFYESSNLITGAQQTTYAYPGDFSDLARDGNNNIITCSREIPGIHKFNFQGDYVGSFNPAGFFVSPFYLSNTYKAYPDFSKSYMNFAVSDFWGTNSGFRLLSPGGEVADVNCTELTGEYRFSFYPLDPMSFELKLLDGNNVIYSVSGIANAGLSKNFPFPKAQLPHFGDFKWVLSYRRDASMSWKETQITFTYLVVRPIIAKIYPNMDPIMVPNGRTRVTATLFPGPVGTVTYL